jgi:capsid assembly protease
MFKQIQTILNAPWAIRPEFLGQIHDVAFAHVNGENFDLSAFSNRSASASSENSLYRIENDVAVIGIDGVLARKMNMMMAMCGGTSTDMLQAALVAAESDVNVKGILLDVSSPGGSVFGIASTAQMIRRIGANKPVVAWCPDMMASAAMWLGSAASKVFIADTTVSTGALGVVMQHVDLSKAQEMSGRKVTDIYAGKFKRIASQNAPLSDAGKTTLQDQVDAIYSVMINDVAAFRSVPVDMAHAQMADGKEFIGQQAIDAGLIDGFATFNEALAMARPKTLKTTSTTYIRGKTMEKATAEQIAALTLDDIRAANPAVVSACQLEGATAERNRILAVEAAALPGHDALIAKLRIDGQTTGDQAAAQVIAAERMLATSNLNAIAASRPAPVVTIPAKDGGLTAVAPTYRGPANASVNPEGAQVHAKAKELMASEKGLSFIDAVKRVQAEGAVA